MRAIRNEDGKRFDNKKSYRVVMPNYLASGGDDLEWVVANLHPRQIEKLPLTLRAALEKHLSTVLH